MVWIWVGRGTIKSSSQISQMLGISFFLSLFVAGEYRVPKARYSTERSVPKRPSPHAQAESVGRQEVQSTTPALSRLA